MKIYKKVWKAKNEFATVFAIHGMMAHSKYFEYFGKRASKEGITVVAADLRGYGKSPGERGRIDNIYEHLEDMRNVVERLENPFLLGHSLGSIYAIHYAYFYGGIKGLVLASPAFMLNFHPRTMQGFLEIGTAFFTNPGKVFDTTRFWTRKQKSLKEAVFVLADEGCTKSFEARYLASMFRMQISAYLKLPFIRYPALFIIGRNDEVISPLSMYAGYALYRGRKDVLVLDSDHVLSYSFSLYQEDNPKREFILNQIIDWIRKEA